MSSRRSSKSRGWAICERPVLSILTQLNRHALEYAAQDSETLFDATQNARLVANLDV